MQWSCTFHLGLVLIAMPKDTLCMCVLLDAPIQIYLQKSMCLAHRQIHHSFLLILLVHSFFPFLPSSSSSFSCSLFPSLPPFPLYLSFFSCFSFLLVSLSLPTWRALSLPAPISSGYLNSILYLNYGLENHKDILHAFTPCLGVCLQRSFQTYLLLQLGILLQSGVGSCTEWDAAWDCLYFLKHTHILSLVF